MNLVTRPINSALGEDKRVEIFGKNVVDAVDLEPREVQLAIFARVATRVRFFFFLVLLVLGWVGSALVSTLTVSVAGSELGASILVVSAAVVLGRRRAVTALR